MKKTNSKTKARRPLLQIQRRWIQSRPGSVLILVIALLVLLALIGTAFLSTTQTERYSSQQNSVNTEADLLVQGLQNTVQSKIANGLFASTGTGQQFRPPGQEMPTYVKVTAQPVPTASTYHSYDSGASDAFLADRCPVNASLATAPLSAIPMWNNISWPLFSDPNGNLSFDSPFEGSATLYLAANKGLVQSYPSYRFINNQYYPGMVYYIPASTVVQGSGASQISGGCTLSLVTANDIQSNSKTTGVTLQTSAGAMYVQNSTYGVFITPMGLEYNTGSTSPISWLPSYVNFAASAAGDGIADGGMSKVPVGPINNITYYYSTRIVDNNSAINASSAWTAKYDPGMSGTNLSSYGFFPTNIGLQELLFQTPPYNGAPAAANEMNALNNFRFTGNLIAPTVTGPAAPAFSVSPIPDQAVPVPPNNFSYYSLGDMMQNQMTRRPGSPGFSSIGTKFTWLGINQSAALAYHFSLVNPNASPSYIEQLLPNELTGYTDVRSTPYSPAQYVQWYDDLFPNTGNYNVTNDTLVSTLPLRTILTGDNPVSNGISPRLGNSSATVIPTWATSSTQYYNFGDWVTDGKRSFVCIRRHLPSDTSHEPQGGVTTSPFIGYNTGAIGYWAGAEAQPLSVSVNNPRPPGMPFTQQAVKASVNTAPFEELWVAFAQVMTDSIGPDNSPTLGVVSPTITHWQPPMQATPVATAAELQLPMFRSVLRDNKAPGAGKTVLTAAQMLKLRAALAAVNTVDLRDSDDDVTSKHIVLDDSFGNPAYDVEVYGTEMQPYISEMVLQCDGTQGTTPTGGGTPFGGTFFALKLVNPYNKPISLSGWQIGSVNRASFPNLTMSAGLAIPAGTVVPAASGGYPGILILYDGNMPADVATTIAQNRLTYAAVNGNPVDVSGMALLAVSATQQLNEVFLLRPRLANGTASKSVSGADDIFDETQPSDYPADLVPVDQIDLSGLQIPAANSNKTARFNYRRGSDSSTAVGKAWNFVYPGYYDPAALPNIGRYFSTSTFNASTPESQATAAIQAVTVQSPNPPAPATGLPVCNLGGPDGGASASVTVYNSTSTYTTVPIELNNVNMAGPNRLGSAAYPVTAPYQYPFGGFARNVDMLQIPFIGAYRIRSVSQSSSNGESNTFTELNSVTIDSALANDTATGTEALPSGALPNNANAQYFNEQIGRFCPVGSPPTTTTSAANPSSQLDFGTGYAATDATQAKVYWHYHWTRKLFNYLAVQAPHDDYYPNTDPAQANTLVSPSTTAKYPGGTPPTPVANNSTTVSNSVTAGTAEDTVGVEGLININTAPLAVLASLPFTSPYSATTNNNIAQGIIAYRTTNGPFKSIMDLYNVPAFQVQNTALTQDPATATQGVFSPNGIGTTQVSPALPTVRYDFQERFLLLNNISNLITTRSDSFTVYLLLQGWRNAGTGNPTLAVQRRVAFFVDRNNVTPSNNIPLYFKFPNE